MQDEPEEEDDYMDEEMKKTDQAAQDRIRQILEDYEKDMKNYTGNFIVTSKYGHIA